MRLTPSWFRGSSEDGSDDADNPESESTVTIYHTSSLGGVTESAGPRHAAEFVPESDEELLATVDEMETPVTVDELADRLVGPAQPSVETWAAVHERLHQERLPALDDAGDVAFDDGQGLIGPVPGESDSGSGRFRSSAISTSLLVAALFVVSVAVLSVVIVSFMLGPLLVAV